MVVLTSVLTLVKDDGDSDTYQVTRPLFFGLSVVSAAHEMLNLRYCTTLYIVQHNRSDMNWDYGISKGDHVIPKKTEDFNPPTNLKNISPKYLFENKGKISRKGESCIMTTNVIK